MDINVVYLEIAALGVKVHDGTSGWQNTVV